MIDTIDSILATGIVILGLSLLTQGLLQFLKHFLHLKSEILRSELLALFDDGEDNPGNHKPAKVRRRQPAHLADRIVGELEDAFRKFGFTDLRLVEDLGPVKMHQVLRTLPVARDPSLERRFKTVLARVDCWFDIGRIAFKERYQRVMWKWSFVIGTLLVVALDANLTGIFNDFTAGKSVREALVSVTPAVISTGNRAIDEQDSVRMAIVSAYIATLVANHSFHIVRWNTLSGDSLRLSDATTISWDLYRAAGLNWFGWLTSAIMISLGAPFWYDFLKMIVGVRDRAKTGETKEASLSLSSIRTGDSGMG